MRVEVPMMLNLFSGCSATKLVTHVDLPQPGSPMSMYISHSSRFSILEQKIIDHLMSQKKLQRFYEEKKLLFEQFF